MSIRRRVKNEKGNAKGKSKYRETAVMNKKDMTNIIYITMHKNGEEMNMIKKQNSKAVSNVIYMI